LDNLFESLKEGELKEVNVIIKADVQGSAEALAASLKKIDVGERSSHAHLQHQFFSMKLLMLRQILAHRL
jgi:translation initiation factor IF-2